MSRKGLLKLVICIACMTFVFSIYTVVALVLSGPAIVNYSVALLDGQTTSFVKGKLTLTGDVDALVYDSENKVYTAVNSYENAVDTVKEVKATVVKRYGKKAFYDIKIYRVGEGSVADPYNINNADVMMERFNAEEATAKSYNLVADIDLAGINYKPLGNASTPFSGILNGNGHYVKNMKIVVSNENVSDFTFANALNKNSLRVGFVGYAKDAIIKNVNLTDFDISFASDTIINNDISAWEIGGLVGYASTSTINGADDETMGKVSGTITAVTLRDKGGVGAIAGELVGSTVENYDIDLKVINQRSSGYIGGIAGKTTYSSIASRQVEVKNCNIKLDAKVELSDSNYCTYVAGAIAQAESINAENITIEKFNCDRLENSEVNLEKTDLDIVSGAFCEVAAYYAPSNIQNVVVKEMKATLLRVNIAGFAYYVEDNITITNSVVCGDVELYGYDVSGFIMQNMANVIYNVDFAGDYAVKASIKAWRNGAGFVNENYGKIINTNEEKKVNVDVKVMFTASARYGGVTPANEDEFNAFYKTSYISGFANAMLSKNAEISGFNVTAELKDGLNMAGLVGQFGFMRVFTGDAITGYKNQYKMYQVDDVTGNIKYNENGYPVRLISDTVFENGGYGVVANCNVTVKVSTIATTYRVAGVVAEQGANTTISNVKATLELKNDNSSAADKEGKPASCVAYVGGLVAQISGDNAVIKDCSVIDSIIEVAESGFVNIERNEDDTIKVQYKLNVIGGLVGIVRGTTGDYFVSGLDITNCTVSNVNIKNTVDVTGYSVDKNTSGISVTNGVGGFIGVVQCYTIKNVTGVVENTKISQTIQLNTYSPAKLTLASSTDSVLASSRIVANNNNSIVTE